MIKKLLIPLDGSSLAEQAVGRGAAIAHATKASIELVLVHDPFGSRLEGDAAVSADEAYLATIADELVSGGGGGAETSVSWTVEHGGASEMICERAKEIDADLIVMTSHARTGIGRLWLGSVADAVVRNSTVAVLLLRPMERGTDTAAVRRLFKHVLVPLDGSAFAAEALGPASDIALASGARISLIRVVTPVPLISAYDATVPMAYPPLVPDDAATRQLVATEAADLDATARGLRDEHGLTVHSEVVESGRVASSLIDYARAHEVDLIAMCTHGRGATRLLVGSVADAVLRGSGLPVLLRRPPKAMVEPTLLPDANAA